MAKGIEKVKKYYPVNFFCGRNECSNSSYHCNKPVVSFKFFHFAGHQFLYLENEYAYEGDDILVANCRNVAETANWRQS